MAKIGNYADYPLPDEWLETLEGLKAAQRPALIGHKPMPWLKYIVNDCLSIVSKEQQEMMFLRYIKGYTLKEIGDIYGLTRERIRQIMNKIQRTIFSNSHIGEDIHDFLLYAQSEKYVIWT